jgi:hypothetical protein
MNEVEPSGTAPEGFRDRLCAAIEHNDELYNVLDIGSQVYGKL